jgi:hypothetical protein
VASAEACAELSPAVQAAVPALADEVLRIVHEAHADTAATGGRR